MELKNVTPGGLTCQLFLLLFALHCKDVCEVVSSEGKALQAFKQRLDDPVGALSNWNDSAPAPGPSRPVRPNKASLSLVQIVLMSVGLFLVFKFGIAVLLIMRWLRKDNEVEINLRKGETKEEDIVIDWPIWYRIALGVARGLSCLHHGSDPRIINGDVSSSNILLDTEFEPYLSDFGLAKLVTTNDTHVSVTVGGTFGYVAPEFAKSGRANEKVDVYGYGVILLELLIGRRAVDESLPDTQYTNLAGCVRELHNNGNAREIIDQNLKGIVPGAELDLLLEVAYHSISLNPHDRPQMNKVVETLELLVETGLSPTGGPSLRKNLPPNHLPRTYLDSGP